MNKYKVGQYVKCSHPLYYDKNNTPIFVGRIHSVGRYRLDRRLVEVKTEFSISYRKVEDLTKLTPDEVMVELL